MRAIDAARCPTCKYLLRGLPSSICPECGSAFDLEELCGSGSTSPQPCTPWDLLTARIRAEAEWSRDSGNRPSLGALILAFAGSVSLVLFNPLRFATDIPPTPDLWAALAFRWFAHGVAILFYIIGWMLFLGADAFDSFILCITAVSAAISLVAAPVLELLVAELITALASPSDHSASRYWRYVMHYHSAFLVGTGIAGPLFASQFGPFSSWLMFWPFAVSLGWWWLSLVVHVLVRAESKIGGLFVVLLCVPFLTAIIVPACVYSGIYVTMMF